jgi:hypothetical protein
MRWLLFLLWSVLPCAGAVQFVLPDESRPLFRRDLLPIDPDTMRVLADQLTVLAGRPAAAADPAQARATAQLISIATRLDPAETRARNLGRKLAAEEPRQPSAEGALDRARAESWHITDWLLHEEAGPEGQRLGLQLVDALRMVDPAHPAARRHDAAGEAARWEGVVAPLARFRKLDTPPPAPTTTPPAIPPAIPPATAPDSPGVPAVPPPRVLRNAASLLTPLYTYDREDTLQLGMVRVAMSVAAQEESPGFEVALSPAFESPLLESMASSVTASLRTHWPTLPPQNRAVFSTGEARYASRNATALSGPMSLLLHTSFTGKRLRENIHFIGEVDQEGSLSPPKRSWDFLLALRKGDGGMLLVPSAFQQDLRALLVLEDPGFFIKYEVLAVSSLDTALALADADSPPPGLRDASALFAGVRDAAQRTPIGQLAVNKIFRDRLGTILERAPYHLSASMLLLQGSPERPTRLDTVTLARNVRHTVDTVKWVALSELEDINPDKVEADWSRARSRLDPLEKFIARGDTELYEGALKAVATLRTLARAKRRVSDDPESESHLKLLTDAHGDLKESLAKMDARLAGITDPPPSEE